MQRVTLTKSLSFIYLPHFCIYNIPFDTENQQKTPRRSSTEFYRGVTLYISHWDTCIYLSTHRCRESYPIYFLYSFRRADHLARSHTPDTPLLSSPFAFSKVFKAYSVFSPKTPSNDSFLPSLPLYP